MSDLTLRTLSNGVTLIAEPLDSVASIALSWLLPVGSATDTDATDGYATMLSELLFRGAGDLDSRAHSDALDRLGVQRSSNVRAYHLGLGTTFLADRLGDALPLITSMITAPRLADDAVDPVRSLALQTLESLEDDPQHQVSLLLRSRFRAAPFNRHGYGRAEVLEGATGEDLRGAWQSRAVPGGTILSAAGCFDVDVLAAQLESLLEGWGGASVEPVETEEAEGGYAFHQQDTAQVHLAFACPAPNAASEDRGLEQLALAVLSGSTSGRLFTEVRQKRSLCYSVSASYRAGRDDGIVMGYAGTTPQRAQETLDVCFAEFERMQSGATLEEFERARIGLKTRIVMSGESTVARAGRLGGEVFALGRARTLDEILAGIDAISLDELNAYLARRSFGPFTVASIGPEPLQVPTTVGAG